MSAMTELGRFEQALPCLSKTSRTAVGEFKTIIVLSNTFRENTSPYCLAETNQYHNRLAKSTPSHTPRGKLDVRAATREDSGIPEDRLEGRSWREKAVAGTSLAKKLDDIEADSESESNLNKIVGRVLHCHWRMKGQRE